MKKEKEQWKNQLYFADNLEVLKRYYKEYPNGFIDLIYIDPPFNSKRNYNVLFESIDLTDTKAQKQAFADTWSNVLYIDALSEIQDMSPNLYNYLNCLDNINVSKSAASYLTTMAIRIYYMHKLLNETGSFYLHCDPTMSHYLKLVCDLIFGNRNFRNEIVWCYSIGGKSSKLFGEKHDIIFLYTKSDKWIFNSNDPNVRILRKPGSHMKTVIKRGQIFQIKKDNKTGKIYEYPLDKIANDYWIDIEQLNREDAERLNFPTQKPEALLKRIISASTNKGDIIADFFCGCGTSIVVAEKLKRKWIGVDISHLAVNLIIQRRIKPIYKNRKNILDNIEIHGFPQDIDSARELANKVKKGRFQFEQWIVEVMLNGVLNDKKNEMGYDGYLTYYLDKNKKEYALIEVKSGNADLHDINYFINIVKNKNAGFGIFVCFEEQITRNMKEAAIRQRVHPNFKNKHKIQIISVQDLLSNKLPDIPESTKTTFKSAEPEAMNLEESQKGIELL
ncbi:MAG: site-specific DNA-methyltransferase [Bacteroidia bacterium]|nr:site-specific DNA-methyltransferase [Bacteroidia bacterium]